MWRIYPKKDFDILNVERGKVFCMLEIEILQPLYACVTDLNFVRLRNLYFPHQSLQWRQLTMS